MRITLLFFNIFLLYGFLFCNIKSISYIEINEAITPATEQYIERAIKYSEKNNFDAILIQMNTPGGLLESTRNIVQNLLNTKLDTIVYIAPPGSRAASAGVFITLSAKYASMAPGCSIGAAHPITIVEQNSIDNSNKNILMKKIENDTISFIESIAKLRKRNIEWAIDSVKNSVSITSEKALSNKVIDFISKDIDELIKQIYGNKINYKIYKIPKSWAEKLLSVLSNPNLAYILLILGIYGIIYEIIHPGTIFSGALGTIFLIIALFSMQTLPTNYAGLFLIILAFILFLLELFIVSYGLLTVGGIISLIIGSSMIFNSPLPFLQLSIWTIISMILFTLLFLSLIFYVFYTNIKKKASSGIESYIGEKAIAYRDFINGKGRVKFKGSFWNAIIDDNETDKDIKENDELIVKNVINLTLVVKKNRK